MKVIIREEADLEIVGAEVRVGVVTYSLFSVNTTCISLKLDINGRPKTSVPSGSAEKSASVLATKQCSRARVSSNDFAEVFTKHWRVRTLVSLAREIGSVNFRSRSDNKRRQYVPKWVAVRSSQNTSQY